MEFSRPTLHGNKKWVMNVLSLFDGISCGQLALQRAGIKYDNYFASEIDKHAIKVTQKNFPNTIQLGDVTKIKASDLPHIDLLIGGSPCQSLSALGDGTGLNGKSGLFFHYLRLREETKAKKFLLENVVPKKSEWLNEMNRHVGCAGIKINSNYFLPQSRNRMYWTNIDYPYPLITNTKVLYNLLETINYPSKYYQSDSWNIWWKKNRDFQLKKKYSSIDVYESICLTARMYASWNGQFVVGEGGRIRRLTPIECERLQGVPDNYTDCINDNERYKALGNGWTVDVVSHILKGIELS